MKSRMIERMRRRIRSRIKERRRRRLKNRMIVRKRRRAKNRMKGRMKNMMIGRTRRRMKNMIIDKTRRRNEEKDERKDDISLNFINFLSLVILISQDTTQLNHLFIISKQFEFKVMAPGLRNSIKIRCKP